MPQIAQNVELPAELDRHRAYLYRYAMLQLRLDPGSGWWRSVLATTGQPEKFE